LQIFQFVRGSSHTVDGSEILRSPVDMENIPSYLQGFKNIPGG